MGARARVPAGVLVRHTDLEAVRVPVGVGVSEAEDDAVEDGVAVSDKAVRDAVWDTVAVAVELSEGDLLTLCESVDVAVRVASTASMW